MSEPTRTDIINKLVSLGDITQSEMLVEMTEYATANCAKPEKLIDDLKSYSIYAKAKIE